MNIRSDKKKSQDPQLPELKPSLEVSSLGLLMMMESIEPSEEENQSGPPTAAPETRPKRGHA